MSRAGIGQPQGKGSGSPAAAPRPDTSRSDTPRSLVLSLCLVFLGGWLIAKGLAGSPRPMPWLIQWGLTGPSAALLQATAIMLGVGLLLAAVALAGGHAWGWLLAALVALAAASLLAAVWILGAGPDWVALFLALATLVALVNPAIREDFLGERPHRT